MNRYLFFVTLLIVSCKYNDLSNEEQDWRNSYRIVESQVMGDCNQCLDLIDSLNFEKSRFHNPVLESAIECLIESNLKDKLDSFVDLLESHAYNVEELRNFNKIQNLIKLHNYDEPELLDSNFLSELRIMYINDQYVRGVEPVELGDETNIKIIPNLYLINSFENPYSGIQVDSLNRRKLKRLLETYGFPRLINIGREGMNYFMTIIQHMDQDLQFQREILQKAKEYVDLGDIPKRKYAYLIDRILIAQGKPQKFGTQFATVSIESDLVELAETQELKSLDNRRMNMDLMPIRLYKKLMLWKYKENRFNELFKIYKDSSYVQNRIKMDAVSENDILPNAVFLDKNKKSFESHAVHNSNTLYLFWATWCGPCLDKIRIVSDIEKQYKNDFNRIITISIDDDFESWRNFLNTNQIEGDHYWIGDANENKLYSLVYKEIRNDSNYLILASLPSLALVNSSLLIEQKEFDFDDNLDFSNYISKFKSKKI